jgi:hypothetical protein
MLRPAILFIVVVAALLAPSGAAAAQPPAAPTAYCYEHETDDGRPRPLCIRLASYTGDVCTTISRAAAIWRLPEGYFARLIWQESHFDANAVSGAGAEGIAQFMPETGRLQGLRNPYDPAEQLFRSARYLDALQRRFGNLGLAAAAYNGGENRVRSFIAGTGYLAAETLDYVEIVTGLPVTDWLAGEDLAPRYTLDPEKPFIAACLKLAEGRSLEAFTPPTAVIQPWGIQLKQFFSSATARRSFARLQQRFSVLADESLMLVAKRNPNFGRRLRYTVEIGRDTRAEAVELCKSVQKAGGACIVVRN